MSEEQQLAISPNQAGRLSKRKIVSWAFWDWGTQPFPTIVTTFVFAVYITNGAFGSENQTSISLAVATTVSGVMIALLAPVLGQNSDRSGHMVRNLRYLTWGLAVVTAALFFVKPNPMFLWLGLGLMGVGAVISEIANVNYNALLDEVSSDKSVGRISGLGWGLGYLGGIVSLLMVYMLFVKPKVGLFGVTSENAINIRTAMVVCAVWMLIFTLPTFIVLKDKPNPDRPGRTSFFKSYVLLFRSVKDLWHTNRQILFFLIASALFRDGLAGVFAFGGVIAKQSFGLSDDEVIMFGVAANVVAGAITVLFGYLDDWLGPKKVIIISLVSLITLGTAIFFCHEGGKSVFWVLGLGMCAFVGPAQSASRGFLTRITPKEKIGEMFGLYATTGRAVSFLAPAMFGAMIVVGKLTTHEANTQYWGILGIVVVIAAGLIAIIPVQNSKRQAAKLNKA